MAADNPADYFRQMLGEWEKMANAMGGAAMRSDEWSRGMNSASGAAMTAQAASKQMMERALAAAHMPSRSEFEDLSARIGRIEESLARIEAMLAGGGTGAPAKPKPTRGRKPPKVEG